METANVVVGAAPVAPIKFSKENVICSRRHRLFRVLNTPQWCWTDERVPAYLICLLGAPDEYAIRVPREEVEKEYVLFKQPLVDEIIHLPARYQVEDYLLHIASSVIYQVTDLPGDCVLEHNHQPSYGYRKVGTVGPRYFRAQREIENQERFARVDKGFVAFASLGEQDPGLDAALAALPGVQSVIINVTLDEAEIVK